MKVMIRRKLNQFGPNHEAGIQIGQPIPGRFVGTPIVKHYEPRITKGGAIVTPLDLKKLDQAKAKRARKARQP